MRLLLAAIAFAAAFAVPSADPCDDGPRRASSPAGAAPARPAGALARPSDLQFVPNQGQWAGEVAYGVLGETVGWLHDDGFTLRLERWTRGSDRHPGRTASGAVVRTRFVAGRAGSFSEAKPYATRHHFLRGPAAAHRRDVPAFGAVTMHGVLPGIDVQFRQLPGEPSGAFEYDLLLAPGADLGSFVAECEGVERLHIDADGRLCATVATPSGPRELIQQAPVAWQERDGAREPLEVRFRLLGTRRYGFVADGRDDAMPAVVDPGVLWGTFLGGGATDRVYDIEWRDGDGGWVGGWTGSTDFPTSTGAFQAQGFADGFVAKLADDGQSLVFATYLGGTRSEEVRALAVGGDDSVFAVGFTNSSDFPTTAGAAQTVYGGGSPFLDVGDAFVSRLSPDGQSLLASTVLGGAYDDIAEDVLLNDNGEPVVVGWTSSTDMPIPAGGYQPILGGLAALQSDGFVLGASADLQSVSFGTFLGGQLGEQLLAIDRDPASGDLAVAGWTLGADFPTTPNVVRPTSSGDIDATLTRMSADASSLTWSTYLGGIEEDAAQAVRFDVDGSVWIGGFTDSPNYPPTLNAPQLSIAGGVDGFVTRVSSLGQSLVFSTLLGGPGDDRVRALDRSSAGLMVVGQAGTGFPVTADATQPQFASGLVDAFATHLTNGGATIAWSSYFGGVGQESFTAVDFGDSGIASIAGYTYSTDFPIAPAAMQGQLLGAEDGVVMRLDLLTDLGPGLQVNPLAEEDVVVGAGGRSELVRCELVNTSDRVLYVDSVCLLVTGAGASSANVTDLRVLQDGALVGAAPVATPGEDQVLTLSGLTLLPGAASTMTIDADVLPSQGASFEVAAVIAGPDAWDVRAFGLGSGPTVGVEGAGRASGVAHVVGRLPGDVDGSGDLTVVDVRRLLNAVGDVDLASDADGDGTITSEDIEATRCAILGRGSGFSAPATVARGGWLPVRALLPDLSLLQASLGGFSLAVGRATPRQLTLRIPSNHPTGLQELVVSRAGRVILIGLVDVL